MRCWRSFKYHRTVQVHWVWTVEFWCALFFIVPPPSVKSSMCASLKADVSVPCSSTLPPIHQAPAETQSLLRISSVKGVSVIVEGCLSMRCCSRALSPTDSGARCLPLLPGLLLCTGTGAMLWQFEIVLSLCLDVYRSTSQPVLTDKSFSDTAALLCIKCVRFESFYVNFY